MLRIGEAAKQYDISNRTLRYWEEMGILQSTRTENGYRFYDDENTARIRQIVMLRKLRMPIAEIEQIFIAADFGVAIDALNSHLESLRQDASVYDSLITLVEGLIEHIKASQSLEHVFACPDTQEQLIYSKHDAPQKPLSERTNPMSEKLNNVRIVRLPAMTVAAYRAESANPEKNSHDIMCKFIWENELQKRDGFRHFGFNNPSPSAGNPVYGYEIWVTIPDDYSVPSPLVKKHIQGGLYASIPTQLNEIGERWMQLANWVKSNETYEMDESRQWLEECVDFETFIAAMGNDSVMQLDLLEPIKLK